jgi:hypothetical protein
VASSSSIGQRATWPHGSGPHEAPSAPAESGGIRRSRALATLRTQGNATLPRPGREPDRRIGRGVALPWVHGRDCGEALMGGRGSGRPPPAYLEDGRVITILTALSIGNTRTAAAAYAGIHRGTFYAWLARRPMFAQAVEKAETDAEVRAAATIVKAAQGGTWQAAAWWLVDVASTSTWSSRPRCERSRSRRASTTSRRWPRRNGFSRRAGRNDPGSIADPGCRAGRRCPLLGGSRDVGRPTTACGHPWTSTWSSRQRFERSRRRRRR